MSNAEYDVWLEGYSVTGNYGPAQFLGRHRGETFKDACLAAMRAKGWPEKEIDYYYNAKQYLLGLSILRQ